MATTVTEAYKGGTGSSVMATTVTEAYKVDGVKVCKAQCGAPLNLRVSVSVWATSVPKAGGSIMGK